jgi:hypothetical protein
MSPSSAQTMARDALGCVLGYLDVYDLMRCQGVNREWNQSAKVERLWLALPLAFEPVDPQLLATRATHMSCLDVVRKYLQDMQDADNNMSWWIQFIYPFNFPSDRIQCHVTPVLFVACQKRHLTYLMRQQVIFAAWRSMWIVLWCDEIAPTWIVLSVLGVSNLILGALPGMMRTLAHMKVTSDINGIGPPNWIQSLDALYRSMRWQSSWWWSIQDIARSVNLQLKWSLLLIVLSLVFINSEFAISYTLLKWLHAGGLATPRDMDRVLHYPRTALWFFLIPQCVVPMLVH